MKQQAQEQCLVQEQNFGSSDGCVNVEMVKEPLEKLLANKINSCGREDKDDAFFVADLSDIVRKVKLWRTLLSRVEPFYAVKCNDDATVLELLAKLGIGFDCASKSEIHKMLELGVSADRIVYANPCKQTSHIRYAAKHQVALITFDNEIELHKMRATYADARLLIRIQLDDSKSRCQLSMKFGCPLDDCLRLLTIAKQLALHVVGVCFHVGSGCYDVGAYPTALRAAASVFQMGQRAGYQFDVLDIGGGFPGQKNSKISFQEICTVLQPALDTHFPRASGVRIIAEPGRFFVASAFSLAVNIIAKRFVPAGEPKLSDESPQDCVVDKTSEPTFMYYVNDGVYGSFNCLLYDHAQVQPMPIDIHHHAAATSAPLYPCSVWGPTCDGLDCIRPACTLPELHVGDWLAFADMGAYTMCAASTFNGMPRPRRYYVVRSGDEHLACLQNPLAAGKCCGRETAHLKTPHVLKVVSSDPHDKADFIVLQDSVCA